MAYYSDQCIYPLWEIAVGIPAGSEGGTSGRRAANRRGRAALEPGRSQEHLQQVAAAEEVVTLLPSLQCGRRHLSLLQCGTRHLSLLQCGKRHLSLLQCSTRHLSLLQCSSRDLLLVQLQHNNKVIQKK